MKVFMRYVRRVLWIFIFLATATILTALIYIRTDSFGHLLKSRVNSLLATNFRGKLTLDKIDASAWGVLIFRTASLESGGMTIARVPKIQLTYSLIPLLWHEVRIEVTAVDPEINLEHETDGEWNLTKALALRSPPVTPSSGNEFNIYIERLTVRGGAIDLAPQGAGGPHYRFTDTDADASIAIKGAGLEAELAQLRARVDAPRSPPMNLSAMLSYNSTQNPGKINVRAFELATQASAISMTGVIRNVQTLDSDVAISINKLAPADVSHLLSAYPLRTEVKGNIHLKGVASAMQVQANLATGGTRLEADIRSDLTRSAPTFNGDLSVARLDLSALVLPQQLGGMLDLSMRAQGEGLELPALVATTKCHVEALRLGSTKVGGLSFEGKAQRGNAQFAGNLENGPGRLNLEGAAVVAGNPQYHVAVKTVHLNAAGFSQAVPPTDLNSQMFVHGSGITLQSVDARIDFQARDSLIARIPLEGTVQARLKAGLIDISRAQLLSRGSIVSLKGGAELTPGARSQISYQVRSDDIAPWLKLAGIDGNGRMTINGTAGGTLRDAKGPMLHAQGQMNLQLARLSSLSFRDAHASYDFAGIGQRAWPRVSVNTQLTKLEASGTRFREVDGQVQIDGGKPPHISLAILVHDENNNADRLAANVVYQPGRIAGSLDQLILVLPDGTWRLARQAQFIKETRRLSVDHFALMNGVRQVTLEASLVPAGEQQIAFRAHAIDLAAFKQLIPPQQSIAGDLSAELLISGTAGAPSIEANLAVKSLVMNSQKLGDLNALVHYRASTAALDLTLLQDPNHSLRLNGDIPVSLEWTNRFKATIGNDQKLRLYSAGIRLQPFGGVAPKTLRDAAGLLQVDLGLTGPPLRPAVNGTIAITNGSGEIVPIGVTINGLKVRLLASPRSLQVAEFSAQASDGTLNGSGSITLGNNYSPGAVDVAFQLHRWPAIATRQYNMKTEGQIRVSGTPDKPLIQGQIDVVDTTIHPNLDFLNAVAVPPPDETILVIQPEQETSAAGTRSSGPIEASSGQPTTSPMMNNLVADLKVNIRRNNWIRHEDAQVELDGKLEISKQVGGPIILVGEVDTVRGWIQYYSKRFTLANGQILFTGGSKIDPSLNIDAQNVVSDYTVDVIVSGTASKPEIKLQSQPQLAQADILSLILFGTTSSQLGQGQKATLQQQAQSMAMGAAGQALSESLGLASLGVDVNGQSVGFGHYLSENAYVAVSPNFGANASSTPSQVASIQYFLRRWLTVTTATMSNGSRQIFLNVNKRY